MLGRRRTRQLPLPRNPFAPPSATPLRTPTSLPSLSFFPSLSISLLSLPLSSKGRGAMSFWGRKNQNENVERLVLFPSSLSFSVFLLHHSFHSSFVLSCSIIDLRSHLPPLGRLETERGRLEGFTNQRAREGEGGSECSTASFLSSFVLALVRSFLDPLSHPRYFPLLS